jgi:hypothetical protein
LTSRPRAAGELGLLQADDVGLALVEPRQQARVERAKEWRSGIVAAAGALAAVAEEVALAGQDLETRYRTGSA